MDGLKKLTTDDTDSTDGGKERVVPSSDELAQLIFERRQEEFLFQANWDEASDEWKDVYYSAASAALDILGPFFADGLRKEVGG